jgi:hypothetical protein
MLTFIFTAYGQLMAPRLADNQEALMKPWDPSTPFKMLTNRVDDCQDVAEAGNVPFTDAMLVNVAYTLVFKAGLYFQDCKEWQHHPIAQHTCMQMNYGVYMQVSRPLLLN